MMDKQLREDIAALLQDIVVVTAEEVGAISSLNREFKIHDQLFPLIKRFREGKSMAVEDAYRKDEGR